MKPSVLALIGEVDALAPPGGALAFDGRYKEWYHFNVGAGETELIVNLGVAGTDEMEGRARGTAILLAHRPDKGWAGGVDAYPQRALRAGRGVDLRIGRCSLRYDGARYHLDAALRDGSIAIEARLSPLSYPVPIRNRVPFGSGSNDWIVVPRLEATGEVRIDGEASALEAVPAYHDHNRGRWYWGDELGWEWGYAREPARREGFTVVFERVTDRFHEPIGEGALLVWEGERIVKAFTGGNLRVVPDAASVVLPAPRVPPVLDLLRGVGRAAVPREITIHARESDDWMELVFTPIGALQLLLPHEQGDGYATLHELAGRYRVRGEVRGRRVEFACTGCCEWAGS